ncbi:MAG: hypothetical protein BroJett017_24620 [Ignavibacteriota bacterium]|jgi:hypothetical protein|nr:T9SS type A sorting domain-containing protein [Ignavibacteriaceae bacterium]GIK61572.1 MAG: hypothetical protein BroJett017_24620 [Ignavibacteriota bacterium]
MFNKIKSFSVGKCILFLFILCFSSVIIAQTSNWTNVKETNINVANANPAGVDIFTNRYGNHIIVQESNILKYYQMDVNGYSNPTLFPRTIESSAVVSPSISGDDNNIYIVYGVGSQIRIKRSINGGLTWSLWTTLDLLTPVPVLGLESVISSGKIHITYLESGIVRYKYRSLTEGGWSPAKEVSNGETGNVPRITAYKSDQMNHVYFMYSKFNGVDLDCKWRRYNVNNDNWDTQLYAAPISNDYIDNFVGIRADNSNVVIYYQWHETNPSWQYYFRWAIMDLNNNWIDYGYADLSTENYRMYSTQTVDNKTHTALYFETLGEEYSDIGLWRSYMADPVYPTEQFYEYQLPQIDVIKHLNLSSAGNEVHVIWKDPYGSNGGNNLRYKYDDQVPLAPTGLAVNPYQYGNRICAKLTWQLNNEPDVFVKTYNAYQVERRIKFLDNPWGPWTVVYSPGGSISQFIDSEVQGAGSGESYFAEYRMRALDNNNHYSAYSSTVMIEFLKFIHNSPGNSGSNATNKINNSGSAELSYNYELSQNYPNPFNPTTTISYSIQNAGEVSLKVYDMLGTEVASLVNENQEAGNYSLTFNAAELPSRSGSALTSGIYFYTLTSGNFMETKKLILLK